MHNSDLIGVEFYCLTCGERVLVSTLSYDVPVLHAFCKHCKRSGDFEIRKLQEKAKTSDKIALNLFRGCPVCNGRGSVFDRFTLVSIIGWITGMFDGWRKPCSNCNGRRMIE